MKQTVEVTHQHLYPLYNQARCLVGTEPPSLCLQYRVYIPHRFVLLYIYLATLTWLMCTFGLAVFGIAYIQVADWCVQSMQDSLVVTSFILLAFEGSTGDQYSHFLVDVLQIKWSYGVYFLLIFMRTFFYLSFAISFVFQEELFTPNVVGFIFHCLLFQQCWNFTYFLICTSVFWNLII